MLPKSENKMSSNNDFRTFIDQLLERKNKGLNLSSEDWNNICHVLDRRILEKTNYSDMPHIFQDKKFMD